MSVTQLAQVDGDWTQTTLDVDIVVPVYNESQQLAASITALRTYLDSSFPFVTSITIADNASTDGTSEIADDLAATQPGVRVLHLDQKGRGRALRAAWSESTATVVSYMDVDLSTGLDALLPLVAPLLSGHSDVAIGTRLAPGAHVVRGARRELISRSYNLLLRSALRSDCTDAQCGFKALRRNAAAELLPLVEDNEWFFDTELLVTAQRVGLRIHEVPVDWVDDTDSRVEVLTTALTDLHGVWRLLGPTARRRAARQPAPPPATVGSPRRSEAAPTDHAGSTSIGRCSPRINPGVDGSGTGSGATGDPDPQISADELFRFAGVGAVSTLAYVGLFAALEPALGAFAANTLAIAMCSLGNTAAHRGLAVTARHGLDRRHRWGTAAALLGISLALTTGALALTRAAGLRALLPQLLAVTVANLGGAAIRFGILRTWVFRPAFRTLTAPVADAPAPTDHQGVPTQMMRKPS
ncbi:MAG: bifunctional glycosyltransferase family 2/GtrA family protein [Acidimicrobiales bacterium]|nr:bifunctional glycosyltransferase family 2/GtrA family protein [Acidimicrobiales bacterium]